MEMTVRVTKVSWLKWRSLKSSFSKGLFKRWMAALKLKVAVTTVAVARLFGPVNLYFVNQGKQNYGNF